MSLTTSEIQLFSANSYRARSRRPQPELTLLPPLHCIPIATGAPCVSLCGAKCGLDRLFHNQEYVKPAGNRESSEDVICNIY